MSIQSEITRIQNNVDNSLAAVAAYGVNVPNGATSDNLPRLITDIAEALQVKPEFAESVDWLNKNGDTSKLYVLPDGFIYAYMYGETKSNPKNILETATVTKNMRYNSSDTLKDATGYIAIDHVAVKSGDVIRINSTSAISSSAGNNRVKYYNSSKSAIATYTGSDARADQLLKITTENGVSSWVVGYYNTTLGNNSTNTLPSQASSIAYMRMNLYVSSASVTDAALENLIVTINEEIGGSTSGYAWTSTGRAFVPADYEDRIIALENDVADLKNGEQNAQPAVVLDVTEVYAPSPQLPADGSETADFDAENIGCNDIYAYIDSLVSKYPRYITKETLGKDESGAYDWNRYTLYRRYYDAWQKVNYPAMYGWTNGSTTIYSVSVSPRIGDTLYTTTYVGTAKGTVTAVSNANQTRTVGGVVYTRNKAKDVAPTLVYTETHYSPYYVGAYAGFRNAVYNASKSAVSSISTYSASAMKDAAGNSYVRYPFGDRDSEFKKPRVIVIGSNEHGRPSDPAEPAIISARMIKDLCECKNAANPFLNLLKSEYMLVFCPVINPYGLTKATYENANKINLDRNFDTVGWGNDSSSGLQGDYGGSENETQYFMNTITESGAFIVTANHGLGTQINSTTGEAVNAGMCHYMFGRNDSKYNSRLLSIGETMAANYNLAFTDYGEAPPESNAKTRSYIALAGAAGGAVEMQAREGFIKAGEGAMHTARILEADYTLLLQFLYMLLINE